VKGMNEIIIRKIEELEEQIRYTKLLDEDLNRIVELFPSAGIWLDRDINITMPVQGMDEVKRILRTFYSSGIHLKEFYKGETEPKWILQGTNAEIYFTPVWSKDEGAACKLIKVGEYTQTYPKYKLVCSDGEEIPMEDVGEGDE